VHHQRRQDVLMWTTTCIDVLMIAGVISTQGGSVAMLSHSLDIQHLNRCAVFIGVVHFVDSIR